MAPQALASADANGESAARINDQTNNFCWNAWDNGPEGGSQVVSPEHPVDVVLAWPREVSLCGLNALWAGFASADVQVYRGPADRPPREASEADWQTIKTFDQVQNQYPRALGVNWLGFGRTLSTRAVRLRITKGTTESHPHLQGKTKEGKRVWLGELLALQPLGDADLKTFDPPAGPRDRPSADPRPLHAPAGRVRHAGDRRFARPPGKEPDQSDLAAGRRKRDLVGRDRRPGPGPRSRPAWRLPDSRPTGGARRISRAGTGPPRDRSASRVLGLQRRFAGLADGRSYGRLADEPYAAQQRTVRARRSDVPAASRWSSSAVT